MINQICSLCDEYSDEIWTIAIKDNKETQEFSGHFKCVKSVQDQMNKIEGHKKSVRQIVKELKLKS